MLSQETFVTAVHEQVLFEGVTVKLPLPPEADAEALVGESGYEHDAAWESCKDQKSRQQTKMNLSTFKQTDRSNFQAYKII
jgi:hypothetical protein